MKLDITRTLGLAAMAIALLMTIISLFIFTDDSCLGKHVSYQTAYWPSACKIEDGKFYIKTRHSQHFKAVASDEYYVALRRDYRDVWCTYYGIVTIASFLAIPFAFPELMQHGRDLEPDSSKFDRQRWLTLVVHVAIVICSVGLSVIASLAISNGRIW